ncbi:MAG: hypothetical protein E7A06_10250 [Clostridiales bacterium]|nr:hypothetical protein [Clostridiales bacterium]
MKDLLTAFLVLYGLLIVFFIVLIRFLKSSLKSKYRHKRSTSYNKAKIRSSRTYVRNYSTCDLDSYNHTYDSHTNYSNDVYTDVYTNDNSYNAVEDMLNFPSHDSGPLYDPYENQLYDNCTGGWDN